MGNGLEGEHSHHIEDLKAKGSFPVVLACAPEDFAEFISGILTKPQTIRKIFRGKFSLEVSEVENIFHLVDQRVRQQNEQKLVQLRIIIGFNDGSSVTTGSLADFLSYAEVKPIVSNRLTIEWTYLIRFQGRQVPERQRIELSFYAPFGKDSWFPEYEITDEGFPARISSPMSGRVHLQVHHTARTWGADIESLLSSHLENSLSEASSFRKFLHIHSGRVSLIVCSLLIALCAASGLYGTDLFINSQITSASYIVDGAADQINALDRKIDFLVDTNARGVWPKFMLYMLLGLSLGVMISIAISVWLESAIRVRHESFILFTKKSKERRQERLRQEEKSMRKLWISVIGGLIISVLGNVVFVAGFEKLLR